MSEPVKNVEIEDVLSSIRRLVSEDHRKPAASRAEDAPRPPGRFVLTDALRVPDPVDEAPVGQDEVDAAGGPEEETLAEDEAQHNEPAFASMRSAVDEAERAAEPPDQDEQHADQAQDLLYEDDHEDTPQDAVVTEPVLEDTDDDHSVDAQPDQEPEQLDTSSVPDEHDATHARQPDADLGVAPWRDPDTTLYQAAGLDAPAQADHPDAAEEDIRPLGEKIAALEEVIGRTDDQWEPDGVGGDDYAGTDVETLAWEDTEPDPVEELRPAPEPVEEALIPDPEPMTAPADPEPDAFTDETSEEDTLLDEAGLRDLVADIVREELQGVLGERITRNVRKLVRREIQRALAVKDLE